MDIKKSDWKLFREKLPVWQEAYMARLNHEYIELLTGDGDASDKFWALEERIKKDRKKPGVMLEVSKGNMFFQLLELLRDGAVSMNDLEGFSEDLRDTVQHFAEWKG